MMGGSLGLALRRAPGTKVTAFARRPETRADALRRQVADAVAETPRTAVREADLVVVCTPILSIIDLVREFAPALKSGAVVTDVGSTKSGLAAALAPVFTGRAEAFIGSHPMAGSEKTGLEAGRADLYVGATVAVTPLAEQRQHPAVQTVRRLWEGVGGRVVLLDPSAHDAIVARTSHLTQIVASTLALTVGREADPLIASFCGPGFRDTTRIAASSPGMWNDIIASNREKIGAELNAFRVQIERLSQALDAGDYEAVRAFLEASREARATLMRQAGKEKDEQG